AVPVAPDLPGRPTGEPRVADHHVERVRIGRQQRVELRRVAPGQLEQPHPRALTGTCGYLHDRRVPVRLGVADHEEGDLDVIQAGERLGELAAGHRQAALAG